MAGETVRARPRVALALGGGAARGWSHLGVLQALEEAGIRPCAVAGTSIGSLVGVVWASGTLPDFREAVTALDRRRLWSYLDVVVPRSGLVDGRKVMELVRQFVPARDLRDLPVPFAAVATDLHTGQRVVLADGDPVEAVRASIAVPGLFTPVLRDGRVLVDGGVVDPVPVGVARGLGADVVIAVDISHRILEGGGLYGGREGEPGDGEAADPLPRWLRRLLPGHLRDVAAPAGVAMPSLREVLLASVAISEVTLGDLRLQLDPPDLLVRPPVGHVRFLDFARGPEAIQAGYEATREALAGWPRLAEVTGRPA